MPLNDDDAAAAHGGGPLRYWLKAAFLYKITELGGAWGGVVIAALVAGGYAAGKWL